MSGDLQAMQSVRSAATTADSAALSGARERGKVTEALQDHAIKLGSPSAVVPKAHVSTTNMQFNYDPESRQMLMRITDPESGRVVRQIPTEDVLRVARAVGMMQGALIKEQA